MKRVFFLIACFLVSTQVLYAFDPPRMHPTDRFIVTVFTDLWQNTPDGMDTRFLQQGVSLKAMQDMPLGRSSFSLAAGLGFTSHNLYSDHLFNHDSYHGGYRFTPITNDYDRNKLSLNYLDIPVQIRYRSRGLDRNFRFYAGIKAGYLVNAHTKYVGQVAEGLSHGWAPGSTRDVKFKEHKLENINKFRTSLTGMVGYGSINLSLSYMLTRVFENNHTEDMFPFSLGISVILF